jgi:hypothetical protein
MSELLNQGKLAAKMVAAMKDIDAVLKNGHNDFQKYSYVRAADVANEARKAMIAHGIAFTYDVVDSKHWESTKEGKSTNYFCELTVNVTFTDADSGETMSGRVVGWGTDTLDKAPFKAMTGAVKYALRMNFLIPDENDPEDTTLEEMRHAKVQQPQTQRARPDSPEPSDADEDFDTHMAKTAPAPKVRTGPVISEPQAKRFFGIAMGSGKSKAQINDYLAGKGYGHTNEIAKSDYEACCEWAASK